MLLSNNEKSLNHSNKIIKTKLFLNYFKNDEMHLKKFIARTRRCLNKKISESITLMCLGQLNKIFTEEYINKKYPIYNIYTSFTNFITTLSKNADDYIKNNGETPGDDNQKLIFSYLMESGTESQYLNLLSKNNTNIRKYMILLYIKDCLNSKVTENVLDDALHYIKLIEETVKFKFKFIQNAWLKSEEEKFKYNDKQINKELKRRNIQNVIKCFNEDQKNLLDFNYKITWDDIINIKKRIKIELEKEKELNELGYELIDPDELVMQDFSIIHNIIS